MSNPSTAARPIDKIMVEETSQTPIGVLMSGEYDDILEPTGKAKFRPKPIRPDITTRCPKCGFDMGFDVNPAHMSEYHMQVMLQHIGREDKIYDMAGREGGVSFTEIRSQVNIAKSTLSDMMKRFITMGILRREKNRRYYKI